MTNSEKYNEIFGMPPDKGNCPTESCEFCPGQNINEPLCGRNWWDEEYIGSFSNDDCEGCMYENMSPDKYPCCDCKNNHKNYWRPKK